MIKEILLAAFIGGILGLGITGGYLTLQNKNISAKDNSKAIITEPTLVPTQPQSFIETTQKIDDIQINAPEDNSLISTEKTSLDGITTPNSHIVIVTTTKSFISESDANGKFNVPITLDSGLNVIKISSIDQNHSQKDTQINVTYSTAKI